MQIYLNYVCRMLINFTTHLANLGTSRNKENKLNTSNNLMTKLYMVNSSNLHQ